MNDKYAGIIELPHHQSSSRPHMDINSRAAQFAPFAALKGFEDTIKETARTTDYEHELDELHIQEINTTLNYIKDHINEDITVKIKYFIKDRYKDGGAYHTCVKCINKIDESQRQLIFRDGTKVAMASIYDIDVI